MINPADILSENPESILFARHASYLAKEGKIDEALEILNTGINANPFYAPGYAVLAEINKSQDLDEAAIEHYELALALDPQSPRDLLALGRYLKESDPETARNIFLKAGRFEPDVPEIHDILSDLESPEEAVDLELSPDTEKALTELTEGPEAEGGDEDFDDSFAELLADVHTSVEEEAEEAGLPEEEESAAVEIPEDITEPEPAEESIAALEEEDLAGRETEVPVEEIPEAEETLVQAPDDEVGQIETEMDGSGEVLEEEAVEEPEFSMAEAEDIAALFGDRAEPEYINEGLLPPDEAEVDTALETLDEQTGPDAETIISFDSTENAQADTAELAAVTGTEPSEEMQVSDEDTGAVEEEIDVSGLYGDKTEGNGAILEELLGPRNGDDRAVDDLQNEVDADSLPDYADILDSSGETLVGGLGEEDAQEYGVLDIEDTGQESYEASSRDYQLTGELDEPVLSDEERAELMAFDEEPEEDAGVAGIDMEEESMEEEDSASDVLAAADEDKGNGQSAVGENDTSLYGDLSSDELEVLSITDTEPVDIDVDLNEETSEGIDYSDILYGHELVSDTEGASESIELINESSESGLSTSEDDVLDVPFPEDMSMLKQSLDVEEPDETEFASGNMIDIDLSTDAYSGGGLADDIEALSVITPDAEQVIAYDLSLDEQDIDDVEHSSLEDLIDSYVGALQGDEAEEHEEVVVSMDEEGPVAGVTIDLIGDDLGGPVVEGADHDQMTATMAEIYVKQGLLSSAIDIYQNLQAKAPLDEKIASRLEELHRLKQEESEEE